MATKVVFLDRDGTINVDHGYVHSIDQWEWIPGAIEGMKILQDAGYILAVVTNQSGIAHKLYTEEQMQTLHQYMTIELQKQGVNLAIVAFCPHGRDSTCDCRKPDVGMARQIKKVIGEIDYTNSWTIGDKTADLGFGKKAGTRTVLLTSKYWEESEVQENKPDIIASSLLEAAQLIKGRAD